MLITERERYLMQQAADYYQSNSELTDIDKWLKEVIDIDGLTVEMALNHDSKRFTKSNTEEKRMKE